MKLSSIISATSLMAITSAFQIPADLADGAYTIVTDKFGNETAVALPTVDQPKGRFARALKGSSTKAARAPLPSGEVGCSNYGLNFNDLSQALSQMYNYCGSSAPYTSNKMFFIAGTVYAYTCEYAAPNTCSAGEAEACADILMQDCGSPSSPLGGYYWIKDWGKNYGYDSRDVPVCTNL